MRMAKASGRPRCAIRCSRADGVDEQAVELDTPPCLFCDQDRVGRDGAKWICYACGAIWTVLTEDDKVFLRVQRILPT